MKNVKTPTSDSWHNALIESLKNPERAAGYIEAILEEKQPEPELLHSALKDVIDARMLSNNLSEEAKNCYERLEKIILKTHSSEIYTLVELLDALGYRIALVAKD
ncbi:MAG: transcriptional regulator [Rivularia sp. (in: cyanobacteria)]